MKKKIFVILALIIAVLLGVIGITKNTSKENDTQTKEETVTINHKYGEIEIKKNPETVVVLDYGALDILDELDIEVSALPKSNLPEYLEKYKDKKYTDIGGIKEFDIEKINEIKPDLIIIEGRQEEFYESLSEIAPTIYIGSDSSDFLSSVKNNASELSKIFNKEDEIEKKIDSAKEKLLQLQNKIQEKKIDASVLFVSDSSLSVFGENSRFNLIYKEFGFFVNDKEVGDSKHGQTISYEYILDKNPDFIFVVDKNAITNTDNNAAKEIMNNDLVKSTDAYKNDNIVYLDPEIWYVSGAGVQSLNKRIDEIEKAVQDI